MSPSLLNKILTEASTSNWELIIGMDSNALDTHYLNQQSWKLQQWALTKLEPIREHTQQALK